MSIRGLFGRPRPEVVADEGTVRLEVEVDASGPARWGYSKPVHAGIDRLFEDGRPNFAATLNGFLRRADSLSGIAVPRGGAPGEPRWHNAYFFGLDAVALYGLLADRNPAVYLEVGSGNSTMFARRAIQDHGLRTRIISIDPEPRADVDALCDEVLRVPLQDAPATTFDQLAPGDILFLDGSHYVFTNTDATVALLDVLPSLPPGVLVHVHDVFLPWDYRPDWQARHYNEQYVLAAYLLGGTTLEPLLPAYFVYRDDELSKILAPLWERLGLTGYETAGHSFWATRR